MNLKVNAVFFHKSTLYFYFFRKIVQTLLGRWRGYYLLFKVCKTVIASPLKSLFKTGKILIIFIVKCCLTSLSLTLLEQKDKQRCNNAERKSDDEEIEGRKSLCPFLTTLARLLLSFSTLNSQHKEGWHPSQSIRVDAYKYMSEFLIIKWRVGYIVGEVAGKVNNA